MSSLRQRPGAKEPGSLSSAGLPPLSGRWSAISVPAAHRAIHSPCAAAQCRQPGEGSNVDEDHAGAQIPGDHADPPAGDDQLPRLADSPLHRHRGLRAGASRDPPHRRTCRSRSILHTSGRARRSPPSRSRGVERHKSKVQVIVPHYAMSGGTLVALAADEIVMDPNAVLGPVTRNSPTRTGSSPRPSWSKFVKGSLSKGWATPR